MRGSDSKSLLGTWYTRRSLVELNWRAAQMAQLLAHVRSISSQNLVHTTGLTPITCRIVNPVQIHFSRSPVQVRSSCLNRFRLTNKPSLMGPVQYYSRASFWVRLERTSTLRILIRFEKKSMSQQIPKI